MPDHDSSKNTLHCPETGQEILPPDVELLRSCWAVSLGVQPKKKKKIIRTRMGFVSGTEVELSNDHPIKL